MSLSELSTEHDKERVCKIYLKLNDKKHVKSVLSGSIKISS